MQRFLLRFFSPVSAQTAHASSHSSVSATDNCFNTYFNTLISRWQVGFEVCSPLGSVYRLHSTRYMLRTSSPSLPRPLSSESKGHFQQERVSYYRQAQTQEFFCSFISWPNFFCSCRDRVRFSPMEAGNVIVSFARARYSLTHRVLVIAAQLRHSLIGARSG